MNIEIYLGKELNYQVNYKGMTKEKVEFTIQIGGQEFDYFVGLGHVKPVTQLPWPDYVTLKNDTGVSKPAMVDVLSCLFIDSQAHDLSFSDWCAEYGYSDDSIKAKKVYDSCNDNYHKLKKVFGKDYQKIKEYVENLDL